MKEGVERDSPCFLETCFFVRPRVQMELAMKVHLEYPEACCPSPHPTDVSFRSVPRLVLGNPSEVDQAVLRSVSEASRPGCLVLALFGLAILLMLQVESLPRPAQT